MAPVLVFISLCQTPIHWLTQSQFLGQVIWPGSHQGMKQLGLDPWSPIPAQCSFSHTTAVFVTQNWANPTRKAKWGWGFGLPWFRGTHQNGKPFPSLTECPLATSPPHCWKGTPTLYLILCFCFLPGLPVRCQGLSVGFIYSCLLEVLLMCTFQFPKRWKIYCLFFFPSMQFIAEPLTE